ncbi:MAG TPA: HAD family hydrolase [Vicinamibacterales bacterium]|nr:HAD family hydrolase [Vicinamibacterales bacterium]
MRSAATRVPTAAVFFDVDFTLIHPGPAFQASGYKDFCARHGIDVDPEAFDAAVAGAGSLLDTGSGEYNAQLYIDYTRRIIEGMGGSGPAVDAAAREIYREWAACHHFTLYDDVPEVLRELHGRGLKIGLISNSHRCMESFQSHFALEGLFAAAVTSSVHGFMKPHPSIFETALRQAATSAAESVMVGDSVAHDVEGARRLGMRAVLVSRGFVPSTCPPEVPVIRSLRELPALL